MRFEDAALVVDLCELEGRARQVAEALGFLEVEVVEDAGVTFLNAWPCTLEAVGAEMWLRARCPASSLTRKPSSKVLCTINIIRVLFGYSEHGTGWKMLTCGAPAAPAPLHTSPVGAPSAGFHTLS